MDVYQGIEKKHSDPGGPGTAFLHVRPGFPPECGHVCQSGIVRRQTSFLSI
ncbi:hypothetical protein B4099_2326 [Heyndrickxia coagulans]|uniref:Uncharacterized protein n=1 Tax=Heyndrickxia coagulans TaxID=1398 RepID=A0A150KHW4_HEYCO|nr:hypothetical protein B4099_2326 [Heyndrickxia coagulans]